MIGVFLLLKHLRNRWVNRASMAWELCFRVAGTAKMSPRRRACTRARHEVVRHEMAISYDQELVKAVAQASNLIQEIHDYCGRRLREESKINFPRGLIGTAASYRVRCPGYLASDQISSCAYGFLYLA